MMALTPKRLFLYLCISISLLRLSSHAHLWSIKLSLNSVDGLRTQHQRHVLWFCGISPWADFEKEPWRNVSLHSAGIIIFFAQTVERTPLNMNSLAVTLKNFFSSQILLAEETKRFSLTRPVFNLKVIEFGSFFAYFHLFSHLKSDATFPKIC